MLERSLPKLPVSDRLTLSVHLDGLAATHDRLLGRPGLFNTAIKAIKAAKALGFRVCTNTTIYKETDPQEIEILFSYLGHIGVDGLLVSPAYSFEAVSDDLYLSREEIKDKFSRLTGQRPELQVLQHALIPQFPPGRTGLRMHPLGQPHPQSPWLALPVLSDRGHPLPHLQGDDGAHQLGQLRGGPGPPLRPVHDALRLRAHRGPADERSGRPLDHVPLEFDLMEAVSCQLSAVSQD